jgi:hypothetical protein
MSLFFLQLGKWIAGGNRKVAKVAYDNRNEDPDAGQ